VALSPRGVVFDFGNVLYHVDYPAMARRLAGDRAGELLGRFVGSPLQIAYETGRADLGGVLWGLAAAGFPCGREAFVDAYLSIFRPVDGMAELLAAAAARVPVGLLSNTSPEHARLFIERVPEFSLFAGRVYSFEVGAMKPAPTLYRAIAERLGMPPEDLVYVDDIEEYARGAEAVGMAGVPFRGAADLRTRLAALGLELDLPGGTGA
jgi:FMN phosphatase YigB (HAD superfamily)